ncbi:hypothetical protein ASNO1_50180 [Corallococcus caeni]|uniref:Uncharacterized protein n=1 Tax=Corallococcus caeni TaxID=3082388 RepID=A0ABQ6QXK1_9BACT|nr:hypothetical protein ASNO1_50180 [Corallococcus sp. NO1]
MKVDSPCEFFSPSLATRACSFVVRDGPTVHHMGPGGLYPHHLRRSTDLEGGASFSRQRALARAQVLCRRLHSRTGKSAEARPPARGTGLVEAPHHEA